MVPPGWFDDQSVEGFNILCNNISSSYLNQVGLNLVKYGQRKLYLITSPKYNNLYTKQIQ